MAMLTTIATATISGCSTEQPRDINYGTDVGLYYVPPGVDNTVSGDAGTVNMGSGDDADPALLDGGTSDESTM
jgi:hypothetical protein